jgi:hypothetical protein
MSGYDTQASSDNLEGLYWTFAVVDNGEGRNAAQPDYWSLASAVPDPSIRDCFNFGGIGVSPIAQGNVQVR